MKTGMMIGMILAAIVAGGAGGFVATELLTVDDQDRPEVAANMPPPAPTPHDRRVHDPRVEELVASIERVERKLDRRERDDTVDQSAEIAALKERIDELETGAVAFNNAEDGAGDSDNAPIGRDEVDTYVEEVLERRETARREAEREEFRQQMERRNENERERVVTTMTEKLSLTGVQQVNVKTKLEEYQTKRGDLFRKFGEARRNNEEFDFRAERAKLETETKNAIEDELTLSQVSTFRELVGEDGQVSNIGREGRRRGFRGFGGRD